MAAGPCYPHCNERQAHLKSDSRRRAGTFANYSDRFNSRRNALVPGRPGNRIAVFARGQVIWRDANWVALKIDAFELEPEAVRQRDVSGLHDVRNLNRHFD